MLRICSMTKVTLVNNQSKRRYTSDLGIVSYNVGGVASKHRTALHSITYTNSHTRTRTQSTYDNALIYMHIRKHLHVIYIYETGARFIKIL